MPHNGHGNGGTRQMKLEDLVSHAMIKKLEPIMNNIQKGKVDVGEGKKQLLKVLDQARLELEEKGVLADYLAWVLAAMAAKSGGHLGSVRI